MSQVILSLLALILHCLTAIHGQASAEPRVLRPNMLVAGDADRDTLEDPLFRKAWDDKTFSYYSLIEVKNLQRLAAVDYFPQGARGLEAREACFSEAWPEFKKLATEDPQSDFVLLSHLTVPDGKTLIKDHQLIYNCIIFKDPKVCDKNKVCSTTGDLIVASNSYNRKVYQGLRWKFGWDVVSIGKYFGTRSVTK